MRSAVYLCSVTLLVAPLALGCGHSKETVVRETVHTLPASVVERQTTTTVETVPQAPIVEKRTTVRSGGVERRTTTTIEED